MASIDGLQPLPWLAVAAATAAFGAWLARRHALRHGLLDQPGERRSHAVPTPRGGGVGIALSWILASAVSGMRGWMPAEIAVAAGAGGLLVAAVGYVDDHRPLSARSRLLAHLLAGLLLALAVAADGGGTWLSVVAFVAVPVLVNVWNFMDGIDGIAASQGALAAAGLGGLVLLAPQPAAAAALPAWWLCVACLAFLPFNFPRARIFLGDVGSGTLGAALAVLLVLALRPATEAPAVDGLGQLALAVLPLSAFLVDATLTLSRRILRGEQWWTPHVSHAYQRLARRVGSHVPVTCAYAGWTAVAILVAFQAYGSGYAARLAVCACAIAAGTLAWHVATGVAREHKETP